jgi:hypothetical protein
MREVVTLQVGQCGNQSASAGLAPSFRLTTDQLEPSSGAAFVQSTGSDMTDSSPNQHRALATERMSSSTRHVSATPKSNQ